MVPSIIFSEYLTLSIPLLDISKNFHNSYHYPFLNFFSLKNLFSLFKFWWATEMTACMKLFLFDRISHGKNFSFFLFFCSVKLSKIGDLSKLEAIRTPNDEKTQALTKMIFSFLKNLQVIILTVVFTFGTILPMVPKLNLGSLSSSIRYDQRVDKVEKWLSTC